MPGDTAEEITQEMLQDASRMFDDFGKVGRATKSAGKAVAKALGSVAKLAKAKPHGAPNAFDASDAEAAAKGLDDEARTQAAVACVRGVPSVDFKPTSSKNVAFDFTTIKSDPKMSMMADNLRNAGIPFTETFADREKGIRRFKVSPDHAGIALDMVDYLTERVPGFDRSRMVNYDEVAAKLGRAPAEQNRVVSTVLDHDVLGEEAGRETSERVRAVFDRLGYEYTSTFDRASGEERFDVLVPAGCDFQSDLRAEAERIAAGKAEPIHFEAVQDKGQVRIKNTDPEKARVQVAEAKAARKSERKRKPERDERSARRQAKEFEHAIEPPVQTKKQGR